MFRTIFATACIGAVNAVQLSKGTEKPATALDVEEVLAKAQSGEYTTEDVENVMEHVDHHMKGKDITDAIDWAAEQGIGFDEVKAMIEGVEVSQAFDKHDIYDFAMDACCHFEVDQQGLDEMLHYAGQKLGITEEQGQELLETAGEVFDISQEEFDQAVQDCFAAGAHCKAKREASEAEGKECDKDAKKAAKKAKKAAKEGDKDAKKAAKKAGKKNKGEKAAEQKLAEADFELEDALNLDFESLTAEDVADFLKENKDALKQKLEDGQEEVVAWVQENADEIEKVVSENIDELKDFAEDLEKELGDIDWDAVKAEAEAYYEEGAAKLEEKKRQAQGKKAAKQAEDK